MNRVPLITSLLFSMMLIPFDAAAHTFREVALVCPLDGTHFKAIVDLSGSQYGMRLDLKPLGATPAPWSMPVCPKDHFPLYKDNFTKDEIRKLRKLVASPAYQKEAKDNSSYYLLAKVYEDLGKGDLDIAHVYLQASWQVEDKPNKHRLYISRSLDRFSRFLETAPKKDDAWKTAHLVVGELERQLGRFEEAAAWFTNLRTLPEFKDGNWPDIIEVELTLIGRHDTEPSAIPHKRRTQ